MVFYYLDFAFIHSRKSVSKMIYFFLKNYQLFVIFLLNDYTKSVLEPINFVLFLRVYTLFVCFRCVCVHVKLFYYTLKMGVFL